MFLANFEPRIYLAVPLTAALDEGDEHLCARDAHLEPHACLQGLREPIKGVPRITKIVYKVLRSLSQAP